METQTTFSGSAIKIQVTEYQHYENSVGNQKNPPKNFDSGINSEVCQNFSLKGGFLGCTKCIKHFESSSRIKNS